MKSVGRHVLVEYYGCDSEILGDASLLEKAVVKAAKDAGATVLNSTFHQFAPVGTSGVVVIQESHLAIHTWPEFQYAAVDLFTCGDMIDPWVSFNSLKGSLKSEFSSPLEMLRGQFELLPEVDHDEIWEHEDAPQIPPKYTRNVWFTEYEEDHGLSLRHKGDKLFDKQSDFQRVTVLDTYKFGKMLTLDGAIMTTENDEYVYHEMITHPALQLTGAPKRVLIVGGGDGGAARECLRYDSLEEVVVAEIDEMVVDVSKEFLPTISSSFGDKRTTLAIGDGIKYVAEAEAGSFDVVIVDSTDPVGPAEGLFSYDFYRHCHRLLRDGGVIVVQSESPRYNEQAFAGVNKCNRELFGVDKVFPYLAYVPTYPTGMWSFSMAVKGEAKPSGLDREAIDA
ncbi:MAG: polyamine aminopropyltransferase, partial [Myxococcota bacterium]|nr:polyamine aminopropyltransferase [Myxococcota bacterium]